MVQWLDGTREYCRRVWNGQWKFIKISLVNMTSSLWFLEIIMQIISFFLFFLFIPIHWVSRWAWTNFYLNFLHMCFFLHRWLLWVWRNSFCSTSSKVARFKKKFRKNDLILGSSTTSCVHCVSHDTLYGIFSKISDHRTLSTVLMTDNKNLISHRKW